MAANYGGCLVPAWLAERFQGRTWRSLRSCTLRVDGNNSAGLDLVASEFGYAVDAVDAEPGQEAGGLRAGAVVIAIDDVRLYGLEEHQLEETFGSHFRGGAQVLLLDVDELQGALSHMEAQGLSGNIAEQGGGLRLGLRDAQKLHRMSDESRTMFDQDIEIFAKKAGLRVEVVGGDAAGESLLLTGVLEDARAAQPELGALLEYWGVGLVSAEEAAADKLEVDGMVMRSLPARNRRRRRANDFIDELEAGGDARSRARIDAPCRGNGSVEKPARGKPPPALLVEDEPMRSAEELRQFEFMDHTADVILHSWGRTRLEAWEQVCLSFFAYMTDLDKVEIISTVDVEATGHDMLDLLYHLLDELLFSFGTEFVICRRVEILDFDESSLRVRARGHGERFDLDKHPQGTEIKAITMHQMKLLTPDTLTTEEGTFPRKESSMEGGVTREGYPFECYVLVDI